MKMKNTYYFDNAATTFPKPPVLYSRLMELYKTVGINGSRGHHFLADEMNEYASKLRSNLGRIFGVLPEGVVLTSSATVAANQIIQGLDYSKIKVVYVSPFEHNATYRPIWAMQQRYGFKLKEIPFDSFTWKEAKTKFIFAHESPDVVICTHASNVFGNVLPVQKIFKAAKEYGATTILDCAQTAGSISTNIKDLLADFALWAGHKGLYGPSGIGGFIINSPYHLAPVLFGGTGISSEDTDMPNSMPERFEIGSMNSLSILGLFLSTDWLLNEAMDIATKKCRLTEELFTLLMKYPDICSVISDSSIENVGVISILPRIMSPAEMESYLSQEGICVRAGLHCAPLAHKQLGTTPEGTVRFSVSYFTSEKDLAFLEQTLEVL